MALILITGISTSGKSTIVRHLRELGYSAYDTDRDAGGAWYHKQTGSRDGEYGNVPERTKQWFDSHEWRIDMDKIAEFAAAATDTTLFLCGGGANEGDVAKLCDKVLWLQTDEATIRHRVAIPREHTYGTHPHELAAIIEGNRTKEALFGQMGATMIDARKQVDVVVSDILSTL